MPAAASQQRAGPNVSHDLSLDYIVKENGLEIGGKLSNYRDTIWETRRAQQVYIEKYRKSKENGV